MERKNEVSLYLQNISLILLGVLFLSFPLVFTTITTDAFALPKQALLSMVAILTLFLFGARMISDRKVILRRTPLDLALILFGLSVFLSTMFAINRYDSLIAFTPMLFAIIIYFVTVNLVKNEQSILFLLSALVIGAFVLSIFSALTYFKVYVLPFQFTHTPGFTPFGSLYDQAIYLGSVLAVTAFFVLRLANNKTVRKVELGEIVFGLALIGVLTGFIITLYQLIMTNPANGGLLLLPFETGYQTAFAAISQDTGRVLQGLLFGSGFGTYMVDFTRYKLPTFNLNPTLWSFTFFRSSSFVLELLATTGLLGLTSFLYLIWKLIKTGEWKEKVQYNGIFIPLLILIAVSFLLPFSFVSQTLIFFLLALFAAIQGVSESVNKDSHYFDIELHFLAAKNSILPLSTSLVGEGTIVKEEKALTKFLPVSLFVIFTVFSGFFGYYVVKYINSDITFQSSLVAASNNALATYKGQISAINTFPYRDVYYRVYSQTNLALANSLASSQNGSSVSAQTQQTIYALIQDSISAGRQAVAISPQTVSDWQNLSSIYRSLIGFGQNAENFALVSAQQAVLLDPNNPQGYINLGGIYYQLGQWENAQRQFQVAISLKPDFANAYYNLGHALENKGNLQGALTQYNTVKTLVAQNSEAIKKINGEITALQEKIGEGQAKPGEGSARMAASKEGTTVLDTKESVNQQPLKLNTPPSQLPQQQPQVKIPAPSEATTSGR